LFHDETEASGLTQMRRNLQIALLLLLASALELVAADDAVPDQRSCRDIVDSQQRLECYDAAAGREATPAKIERVENVTPTIAVPPVADVAAAEAVEAEAVEAEAVKAVVVETVETVEAVAVNPKDSFGLPERVPEPQAKTEESGKNDSITGVVTNVSQGARGVNVVTLDNGQVWAEDFSSRYFPVKIGDTITIKKRRFSGFRLVTESGKGFAIKRVR
jgi:hypothetical protein